MIWQQQVNSWHLWALYFETLWLKSPKSIQTFILCQGPLFLNDQSNRSSVIVENFVFTNGHQRWWHTHTTYYHWVCTYINQRLALVEQKPLTLPEHPSSPSVCSGVHVTRSLVLCVCFVDRCLFFCTNSFGHCVVCSSSIYRFWLPLWYLQTLLAII